MATVEFKGLVKHYGATRVVHGIDLSIADGEFIVLVGPSGCGKTTLMRMVAGLEDIDGGDLNIDGVRANAMPPQERNIGMVFQSYALYPHLSVYDNIAFGPKLRKEAQASYQPRIEAAARMLNLTPLLERLPRALSGGQRQRVAMGRAIVREPKLFLFDEPLSNLDAKLRVQMRTEIKALHQRLRNTIIYVTHDQVEAMTMADRIVVMNAGRIEQVGAPLALYDRPANLFVAGFIGSPGMNFIEGTVIVGALHCADGTVLPLPGPLPALGRRITLGIRPEHIDIVDGAGIAARALVIEPTGAETYVYAKTGSNPICIAAARRLGVAPGQEIALAFAPERLHFFDSATGARIVL